MVQEKASDPMLPQTESAKPAAGEERTTSSEATNEPTTVPSSVAGPSTDPPVPVHPVQEEEVGSSVEADGLVHFSDQDSILEAAPQAPETDPETDSTLESDFQESTRSLTSSIYDYRKINGRAYHRETGTADYWGAVDDQHAEVLDIHHHIYSIILDGKLFLAPLKDPKRILDIGTGTGIWAIDMADLFQEADVIGTDIVPIQTSWVPPNLRFEMEDCTQDWTFPHNSFDYVHMRYLIGSIVDWTALYKEAFKVLQPGGWLENAETSPFHTSDDGTVTPGSASVQFPDIFRQVELLTGRTFRIADGGNQRKAMEAAGFVDIQEFGCKMPTSGWAADPKYREIGEFLHLSVETDLNGSILYLTSLLGWTKDETEVFIVKLRRELRTKKIHTYFHNNRIIGRKP